MPIPLWTALLLPVLLSAGPAAAAGDYYYAGGVKHPLERRDDVLVLDVAADPVAVVAWAGGFALSVEPVAAFPGLSLIRLKFPLKAADLQSITDKLLSAGEVRFVHRRGERHQQDEREHRR